MQFPGRHVDPQEWGRKARTKRGRDRALPSIFFSGREGRVLSGVVLLVGLTLSGLGVWRASQAMECEQYWDATLIEASDPASVHDPTDTADTGWPDGAIWVSSRISAVVVYGPGKTPGYEVELFEDRDAYLLLTLEDR